MHININIPLNIKVSLVNINGIDHLTIVGPLGQLVRKIHSDLRINLTKEDLNKLLCLTITNNSNDSSMINTFRSLINNMIIGVTNGYSKKLKLEGIGYRVVKVNNTLIFNIGYSHEIVYVIPQELEINVLSPDLLEIKGIDKELVGKVAAELRSLRKPSVYHIKGIYYSDEVVSVKNTKKK
jgi:large subunit ribosomal protein L6